MTPQERETARIRVAEWVRYFDRQPAHARIKELQLVALLTRYARALEEDLAVRTDPWYKRAWDKLLGAR